jgi:hypothetical protein
MSEISNYYHLHLIYSVFLEMSFHNQSFELMRGRIGHDRMIVGFTTTCEISAYHH